MVDPGKTRLVTSLFSTIEYTRSDDIVETIDSLLEKVSFLRISRVLGYELMCLGNMIQIIFSNVRLFCSCPALTFSGEK
jgi:hypothetical protein